MSWICSKCGLKLVNIVKRCVKCKQPRPIEFEEAFDEWDAIVSERVLFKLEQAIGDKVTEQEKLYAKLFAETKHVVKDMDVLTMRAWREELQEIAFKARAQLYAVDDELKERTKKTPKPGEMQGFQRNLNIDDVSSDAINNIKAKKTAVKKDKNEELRQNLLKIMSPEAAERAMQARYIKDKVEARKHAVEGFLKEEPASSEALTETSNKPKPNFAFVNPFKK